MKKNKTSQSTVDQKDNKDKATTVFLKLYAKRRGKYTGWNSLKAETLPIENEIKPKGRTDND
jgi:hypothetical protein